MAKRRKLTDQLTEATEREAEELHTLPPTQPPVLRQRPQRWVEPGPRKKVNWEVDAGVAELVGEVAKALKISPAAAATRFVFEGLTRYAAGEADFDGYLFPAKGPKYKWVVIVDTKEIGPVIAQKLENQ